MLQQENNTDASASTHDLSSLLIPLLKGVVYRETDGAAWNSLLDLQARVREYVAILNLELVLDEAEGYAFLRSRAGNADDSVTLPRLVARRPLSFPVSLLLALLRKKLAESDASGADTRLILVREQIVDMVRVFLPTGSNEAKLTDQIDTHVNKIIELGFLRKLKPTAGRSDAQPAAFEVQRILKAFVDAQWLADFDARLATYEAHLGSATQGSSDD